MVRLNKRIVDPNSVDAIGGNGAQGLSKKWTPEESELLAALIEKHSRKWGAIAEELGRSEASCHHHWYYDVKPKLFGTVKSDENKKKRSSKSTAANVQTEGNVVVSPPVNLESYVSDEFIHDPPVQSSAKTEALSVASSILVLGLENNEGVEEPTKKKRKSSGNSTHVAGTLWSAEDELALTNAVKSCAGNKQWDLIASQLPTPRSATATKHHWYYAMRGHIQDRPIVEVNAVDYSNTIYA